MGPLRGELEYLNDWVDWPDLKPGEELLAGVDRHTDSTYLVWVYRFFSDHPKGGKYVETTVETDSLTTKRGMVADLIEALQHLANQVRGPVLPKGWRKFGR